MMHGFVRSKNVVNDTLLAADEFVDRARVKKITAGTKNWSVRLTDLTPDG